MPKPWKSKLAFLDVMTGDNRRIMEITHREPPLTLRVQREDDGVPHSVAIPAGRIDEITIDDDGVVWGSGVFSANGDGRYAEQVVAEQTLRGVSLDPSKVVAYEYVLAADGTEIPLGEWYSYLPGEEPWEGPFEHCLRYDAYEIAAATIVPKPAFADASIWIDDTEPENTEAAIGATQTDDLVESDTASARHVASFANHSMVLQSPPSPAVRGASRGDTETLRESTRRRVASTGFRPPADAFAQRSFTGYQPFSVDLETREISGHVFAWDAIHRGFSGAVRPPRNDDFTQFLTGGTVTCEGGERFHVGVLTHRGGHGDTIADYERIRSDPANQLGPVLLYADEFGVQAAGVAWPDIPEADLVRAAAAYPSGDWRYDQLAGVALVNNPGYHAFELDGVDPVRLVASFTVPRRPLPSLVGMSGVKAHVSGTQAITVQGYAALARMNQQMGR